MRNFRILIVVPVMVLGNLDDTIKELVAAAQWLECTFVIQYKGKTFRINETTNVQEMVNKITSKGE